jgi:hypothetical protein
VAMAFLAGAAFFSVFFSTLGSAFFVVVVATAAGFASFLASFTVPEAPTERVSNVQDMEETLLTRVDRSVLFCGRDEA